MLLVLLLGVVYGQEELSNADCNHWLDPGDCNNFTVKWYYDRYDHRCRRFHYSGCGGNPNTFNSLEECSATCTYNPPSAADRCSLPHEPGTCNSDIERWFFDWNKKQCVCSYWTGCGGNSNLFYSYNHCMEICGEFGHPWIGPGIDEKYWGVLNMSSMSPENQAIFVNKPAFVYPPDAWWNPANSPSGQAPAQDVHTTLETSQYHPEFVVDNDYPNDYREMTASETKLDMPMFARGAKTVTVEKAIPEVTLPSRRYTKKVKKQKVPPRRIIPAEEGTTAGPSHTTFSHTYHTDSRGNQITPTRESTSVQQQQQVYQTRHFEHRLQAQPRYVPAIPEPVPTQFYVTYKTDPYGRQVWNQKIWWTGDGPMPIQALRSRYPYWLPPPYDGFGKNPYKDYERPQETRRWNTVTAPPTTVPTTSPWITSTTPVPSTSSTSTTTTKTPAPTTTQFHYTTTAPEYVRTTITPVQTTVPTWVRRYPSTTRPWWSYTTTPRPTQPTTEPTLRQFVRQPPSYIPATDLTPHHFERPLVQDMSTRPSYTTSRTFTPVRTAAAEPVQHQRRLVQQITTEKPELSIDDIIALDEETYDDYDMQMEPDAQDAVQQPQRMKQPVSQPSYQQRPTIAPARNGQRNDGWAPIVSPPQHAAGADYANTFDFDIQSHGDM